MEITNQIPTENQATSSDTKPDINSQSVFITDPGIVKTYPKTVSDDEINYDIQTNVKGKSPLDFFVNYQPQQVLLGVFKNYIDQHLEYLKYGEQAMKLFVVRPDVALGVAKDLTPEQLSETYKPWVEIMTDSPLFKKHHEQLMEIAQEHPVVAFVPWFMTEYMPAEIAGAATKPSTWLGMYGVQRFGPPIINKLLSKLPEPVRRTLLKDIFKVGEKLSGEFDNLGISPNAKTSEVIKAFKDRMSQLPPLYGGESSVTQTKTAQDLISSYQKIMQSRAGILNKLFGLFRSTPEAEVIRPKISGLLTSESGQAIIPFNEGDIVKVGKDIGQFIKQVGEMAMVNIAGKATEVALSKIKPYEVTPVSPTERKAAPKEGGGITAAQAIKRGLSKDEYIASKVKEKYGIKYLDPSLYDNRTDFVRDVETLNPYEGGFNREIATKQIDAAFKIWGDKDPSKSVRQIPVDKIDLVEPPLPYKMDMPKDITEPIEVIYYPTEGRYHLVDGRHRLAQAKYNKQKTIPATVEGETPMASLSAEYEQAKLSPAEGGALPPAEAPPAKPPVEPPTTVAGEPAPEEGKAAVNLENINSTEEAKARLKQATGVISDELQNQTGEPVTHEEVINKAKEAEILTKGVSREATVNFEAALLKTRQHLAALAEQKELTPEFLETLKIVANSGTDIARQLESFKIEAMPEYATQKTKIIKDIMKLGKTAEEILAAAKGVDFTDQEQAATFYRKFVKPKLSDEINEFAYINILSSPKTHIVNTFSNLLQLAGLNPLDKLASGGVDVIRAALTGSERTHYINEIPEFYKGAVNAVPEAVEKLCNIMQGKQKIERPDVKHIPTQAKWINYATFGVGKYIPRALEASDVFFRTMIEAGEREALSIRYGRNPTEKEQLAINKKAARRAEYYVFRQKPDPENKSGQGDLLTAIDKMTSAVYKIRQVPGARWFIRFVQTPMNILKQGLEHSPAGIATAKGAKDKSEQIGKSIVGSIVFALGSYLAMAKRMTWSVPTSKKDRSEFYAAGMQPYSIKIGNTWVSYSKLGPLAYPLAMAGALHYYTRESPSALADTAMEKGMKVLGGIMEFFGDQSYVQGLGDLVKTLKGDTYAMTKIVTSIPTQLIPLSSLQGWVNQLIDPLYRKPETGLSVKAITDNLKQKLIGLSQTLAPQKDIYGQPAKKSLRGISAISPVNVRKGEPQAEQMYRTQQGIKQQERKIKKMNEDIVKQYNK